MDPEPDPNEIIDDEIPPSLPQLGIGVYLLFKLFFFYFFKNVIFMFQDFYFILWYLLYFYFNPSSLFNNNFYFSQDTYHHNPKEACHSKEERIPSRPDF